MLTTPNPTNTKLSTRTATAIIRSTCDMVVI